ncbi:hypothetical protein ES703_71269 [subsurface metagenome]
MVPYGLASSMRGCRNCSWRRPSSGRVDSSIRHFSLADFAHGLFGGTQGQSCNPDRRIGAGASHRSYEHELAGADDGRTPAWRSHHGGSRARHRARPRDWRGHPAATERQSAKGAGRHGKESAQDQKGHQPAEAKKGHASVRQTGRTTAVASPISAAAGKAGSARSEAGRSVAGSEARRALLRLCRYCRPSCPAGEADRGRCRQGQRHRAGARQSRGRT